MLHQHLEQREFAGGEGDVLAVLRQTARGEVEAERAELHRLRLGGRRAGRRGGRAPPQHRLDAREQFPRVERLGQVIVGADFQPDDAVDVVALGRQHDDRQGFAAAAQALADGEPVLARQHQVEDHQVVALAREVAVHLRRVGHHPHRVALLVQVAVQQVAQAGVVVDDQYPGLGFGHVRIVPICPSRIQSTVTVCCGRGRGYKLLQKGGSIPSRRASNPVRCLIA